jgi:hypothetical protein
MALTFSELFAYLIGYAPAEASRAVASMIRMALRLEKAGAQSPVATASAVAVVPPSPPPVPALPETASPAASTTSVLLESVPS